MNSEKSAFIKLALQNNALQFGEFSLKSGRVSPYFFNIGLFYKGSDLLLLGQLYAQIILNNKIEIEHLFGPAYKGIPLVTATAIALAEKGKPCTITFNRKEVKNHGEGGQLIGAPLNKRTAIIDDVITAGTAFREAQSLIKTEQGILTTLLIALDRCEQGITKQSALDEIRKQGIAVYSIITIYDLMDYLKHNKEDQIVKKFEAYLALNAN